MCRYGDYGPYKEIWACFACRKSFKQINRFELTRPMPVTSEGERYVPCPQCRRQMHNMGRDSKAPKQNDLKQWRKVEILYCHGYAYHSCGCVGPGPRPAMLRDVDDFLRDQERRLLEEQRTEKIERRAAERSARRKKQQRLVEQNQMKKLLRKQ